MMTAQFVEGKIKLLSKTLFPSGMRYCISRTGLSVCLDNENDLIILGQIMENGKLNYLKIIPFTGGVKPKSISLINNNIILGGKEYSEETLVSYSINQDKFFTVDVPENGFAKSIDDLLVNGYDVIAVDNVVEPKYLFEYDFQNPDYPYLIGSYKLPENGPNESIKKGCQNNHYLSLFSSTAGMMGGAKHINIFKKHDYENFIGLLNFEGDFNDDSKKIYNWKDIILLQERNVLLISSAEEGIGIYFINDELLNSDYENESSLIYYLNKWEKSLIKVILPPNDKGHLILIFEDEIEHNTHYTCLIEKIDDLVEDYSNQSDYDSNFDNDDNFDCHEDFGDSDYCPACQESPCMCSHREDY